MAGAALGVLALLAPLVSPLVWAAGAEWCCSRGAAAGSGAPGQGGARHTGLPGSAGSGASCASLRVRNGGARASWSRCARRRRPASRAGGCGVGSRPRRETAFEITRTPLERGRQHLPALGVRVSFVRGLSSSHSSRRSRARSTSPRPTAGELAWLLSASSSRAGEKRLRRVGGDWEFGPCASTWPATSCADRLEGRRAAFAAARARTSSSATPDDPSRSLRAPDGRSSAASRSDLAMTPLLDLAAVALRRHGSAST